jgi:hypothetical protein
VVSPDPLPTIQSTSSPVKATDPHSPGHSAFLVETEETPEKIGRGPDDPEPAVTEIAK